MTTITEPGLYNGIPEDKYHADPTEQKNSLSSTMAKEILKSPAHLRYMMDNPPEPKPVFDFGSLVHSQVLGIGAEVELIPFKTYHSQKAKDARDRAYNAGKIPFKEHEWPDVENVVNAVKDHEIAGQLFSGDSEKHAEISMFAQHDSGLWLRGRADWITEGDILVDLKTTLNSDPAEFARTSWNFGYALQAAHYLTVFQLATGRPARGFVHVLVSKEAPYNVSVVQLDRDFLDIGYRQLGWAMAAYRQALESGEWPGYPNVIHTIGPQPWMEYQIEELGEKYGE